MSVRFVVKARVGLSRLRGTWLKSFPMPCGWILGADQLARLDRWKDVAELCSLVEFAVLSRDGISTVPPPAIAALIRLTVLKAPAVQVSSTALREALRRGDSARNGLPLGVARHIDERSLYQA